MVRTVAAFLALLVLALPAGSTEAGWALLRDGGHVVLLRHARAPAGADPANFKIDDCHTQRNLSEAGESQARRIGALFAARAAPTERVLSSRYCRALDTARLAFGDDAVEPFSALDALGPNDPAAAERSAEVMDAVRGFSGSGNLVMVTHAENIAALTGGRQQPREGEALIVAAEGDALHVLGRIVFN